MWIEVQIEVALEASELVAEAMGEITGGVEVRDSGTLIRAGDGRATVVALCPPERVAELLAALQDVCGRAREAGLPVDPVTVQRREAHEDEWRDIWKKYFRAIRVGQTFIVRPSWDLESMTPAPGDRVIDIDPGRAFGTGGHATTRLAIGFAESLAATRAQAEQEQAPTRAPAQAPTGGVRSFLDLGCGSGILSIAAARLWPQAEGLAIDNDSEATACAQENLDLNGITRVKTMTGTLDDAAGPHDVILANIQADVLLTLAADVPRHLAPGGALILSGLLSVDAPPVAARYQELGFRLAGTRTEDEWTSYLFTTPTPATPPAAPDIG
jgi:ribosomal protein L11 methyltransferase